MTAHVHPAAFVTRPPGKVLFLCVHNASRSQMAEGFARALAPDDVMVMSAGSEPREVHAKAIEVMNEIGIDISAQTSKHLDHVPCQDADTVVTLCGEAQESCPTVAPTVRRLHWPLPDPSAVPPERQLEVFREVRDEIRWRVASLWPHGD